MYITLKRCRKISYGRREIIHKIENERFTLEKSESLFLCIERYTKYDRLTLK